MTVTGLTAITGTSIRRFRSLLFLGVYRLIGLFGAVEYRTWAFGVGLILLAVDVGNLILLRDLASAAARRGDCACRWRGFTRCWLRR